MGGHGSGDGLASRSSSLMGFGVSARLNECMARAWRATQPSKQQYHGQLKKKPKRCCHPGGKWPCRPIQTSRGSTRLGARGVLLRFGLDCKLTVVESWVNRCCRVRRPACRAVVERIQWHLAGLHERGVRATSGGDIVHHIKRTIINHKAATLPKPHGDIVVIRCGAPYPLFMRISGTAATIEGRHRPAQCCQQDSAFAGHRRAYFSCLACNIAGMLFHCARHDARTWGHDFCRSRHEPSSALCCHVLLLFAHTSFVHRSLAELTFGGCGLQHPGTA